MSMVLLSSRLNGLLEMNKAWLDCTGTSLVGLIFSML